MTPKWCQIRFKFWAFFEKVFFLKKYEKSKIASSILVSFWEPFGIIFRCFFGIDFWMLFWMPFFGFWVENGSQNGPFKDVADPPLALIFATFSEAWFFDAFWSLFGSILAPFWLPLAPFGVPLAPFWHPFGSLWLPFGAIWLPFGSLLPPLATFGSTLAPFFAPLASIFTFFYSIF